MQQNARWEPREITSSSFSITWKGSDGATKSAEAKGLDVSHSGVGLESPQELKPGSLVYLQSDDASMEGECVVVHCTRRGSKYHVGLEMRDDADPEAQGTVFSAEPTSPEPDPYDVLQISPKADSQTIHRVFRLMAARFHPDNPETGDLEQFLRMKAAYSLLSDPERRAEYDRMRETVAEEPMPIFGMKEFVTGVDAEANRRLGVCSLLYNQRRMNPDKPVVSLLDLEQQMGFPREYLSFTIWYLRAKEYITVADNSDFALTAAGADYVERKASRHEVLSNLLKPGGTHIRPKRSQKAGSRTLKTNPPLPKPPFLLGSGKLAKHFD